MSFPIHLITNVYSVVLKNKGETLRKFGEEMVLNMPELHFC